MSKRKSPNVVHADNTKYATNRAAKSLYRALGIPHTAVPMSPWYALRNPETGKAISYISHGEEVKPVYVPHVNKSKYPKAAA